jgi:glycine betaine catabolism B
MRAVFVRRKQITDTITSFSFKPDTPFDYTAGQFIELTLTGHEEHGAPAKRWFTLSSSPHEELLTITTRIGKAAHTPFKRALETILPGNEVDISEPLGDFVLPKLHQTPLVFIAGGIGITPFHSILSWMIDAKETRDIHLIYAVKTEDDIIFQDTFDAANQHATIVVENPSAAWGGQRGQLTAEMILDLEDGARPADTLYYLSGPEPFVQALEKDLLEAGVSNQHIVVDEFQGYEGV